MCVRGTRRSGKGRYQSRHHERVSPRVFRVWHDCPSDREKANVISGTWRLPGPGEMHLDRVGTPCRCLIRYVFFAQEHIVVFSNSAVVDKSCGWRLILIVRLSGNEEQDGGSRHASKIR